MFWSRMAFNRAAAVAFIGAAALCAPAFADSTEVQATALPDATLVVHQSNGKSTVIPLDAKLAKMLLDDPESKPLDTNIIVFVSNNKAYMVKDHKMANGEMMVASILRDYVPPGGGG